MLGKAKCRHLPWSGCKPIPHFPGEMRGVPWVMREYPARQGQLEAEQSFA